ncbi:MAG: hypothetical protein AABX30_03050 [Nanoarchaeota archaeon]
MNKRGWIRVVEAFVAILLIVGVLLFVMNKGYIGKADVSEKVYDIQINILRNIELNTELRQLILNAQSDNQDSVGEFYVLWTSNNFPNNVKEYIKTSLIDYDFLECEAKICELDKICAIPISDSTADKDVYAQAVAIAATTQTYAPRQLKLFCWMK